MGWLGIRDKGRPRITSLIQRGVGAGFEAFTLSFLQRNKLLELTGYSAATTLIKCMCDKVHFIKVAPVLRCRPQVYKQISTLFRLHVQIMMLMFHISHRSIIPMLHYFIWILGNYRSFQCKILSDQQPIQAHHCPQYLSWIHYVMLL